MTPEQVLEDIMKRRVANPPKRNLLSKDEKVAAQIAPVPVCSAAAAERYGNSMSTHEYLSVRGE